MSDTAFFYWLTVALEKRPVKAFVRCVFWSLLTVGVIMAPYLIGYLLGVRPA